MTSDLLPGTANVVRFPVERRARPTLDLLRAIAARFARRDQASLTLRRVGHGGNVHSRCRFPDGTLAPARA
jgi:hypothetical protein